MDNFIDKLAQKFTAGEVIKANTIAEERELNRLREQVAEYEKCLQEMRKIQMTNTQTAQNLHDMMVESMEAVRNITKESEENLKKANQESKEAFERFTEENVDKFRKFAEECVEKLQETTKEGIDKISQIQVENEAQKAETKKALETTSAAMEQMEEKTVKMQETVASLTETLLKNQKEIEECFKRADDFLHRENVKVYRNVQAVVIAEVGNKAEEIKKAQEETVKKSGKPILIFAILGFVAAAASLLMQILAIMGIF